MFKMKNYMKLIKTFNYYCAFLTMGLLLSVVGPSLLDLQRLINTDTQQISLIYTARSTGYILGAILSGVVLDAVRYPQAVLSVCSFVAGGSMMGIPWSKNFATMISCMVVNGMFLGALETGGNVGCLNLWGKESGPAFQGLQFSFGLGGFVAPLIAAPFLEYRESDNLAAGEAIFNSSFVSLTDAAGLPAIQSSPPSIHPAEIIGNASAHSLSAGEGGVPGLTYPFSITGLIACLTGFSLMATSIVSPTDESPKDEAKQDNSKRSSGFMWTVVLLNFLLIFVSCAMEIGYAQMLTSYAVKGGLHLTVSQGSYLTSAFWAAFAISRLASVFLAIRIKDLVLLMGDLVLVTSASLMLLLLMPSEGVLWTATVLFGTGIGSFYASTIGWVNSHIFVTNKIASIITVGAASGEMVGPVVISYFMDQLPDIFAYVIASACALTWLVVLAVYVFFRRFDKKIYANSPDVYKVRTVSTNI